MRRCSRASSATGGDAVQAAIASRAVVPSAVAAALAELGSAEACQILAENDAAEIAPLSIDRMVERFGDVAAIRDALLTPRGSSGRDAAKPGDAAVANTRRLYR
jgi:uncharacterized protein (DUF2336 family)